MEISNVVSTGMTQKVDMTEPVAVVAVTEKRDGSISVQRVGAFESRLEFERYVEARAASEGGFPEGHSILTGEATTNFIAAGLGKSFDVNAEGAAVAVFQVDPDDGEVEFLSQYKSAEEFSDIMAFANSDALSGKVSADVAVRHQDLENQGYVLVSIGEFVK